VNGANAAGEGDWSEVWSFTTEPPPPPVPSAPTLASPANGATGVSTSPTLTWNASSGATSYRLQVSTSSNFSTTVVDQSNITTTSYRVSGLAASTTYYWRVNASNAGGTSPWSAVWSFTTGAAPPKPPPDTPILLSPADGAVDVSISPIFTWRLSIGATSYQLQVSRYASFSALVVNQSGLTDTSYRAWNLPEYNKLYYWRVNASGADGRTSDWSTVWSFRTVRPPSCSPPSPPAWVTASRGLPDRIELNWGDASAPCGFARYNIYRKPCTGTTWTLVAYVGFETTFWVDYPPQNCPCRHRYGYKITTVDSNFYESPPSQEVNGKMDSDECP